ncbi:MAG: sodium:proton antiporter [Spirulina sp. SIO3F2]|nr:sodium:proton antiporter [Spirulina sp. SIO3F2]
MEGSFVFTSQIVIAVLAGIGGQVLGEVLRIPSIVFLLLFGIFLGSDGLALLHPHDLGVGLEVMVALAVAIILFEGGLNLELRALDRVSGSLRNLVTLGILITLLGGGMAAHWLSEFPWPIAFLYASLVVVTGPTVIGPLLKQVSVDRQVATLLEGEGVLIDPVGAILAVVVLDTLLNQDALPLDIFSSLLLRLSIGIVVGGVGGWLLGVLIKTGNRLSEDLKNLVVLAGVWGLFGLAQYLYSESGLMTAVVSGLVLRASGLPEERMLRRFKGQLTVLAVSVLFVLLSADLSLASIWALGWGSLGTVLVLMLVMRPLSVLLCTWNSGLNWRQKFFVAWVAPKGIVSASVASLFSILLTEQGISGGDAIKALVFLTIIMTVFIQGLSARWVAQGLRITSSEATGAVIVGCNDLGRLLGRLFTEAGESVVMIDTDAELCTKAQAEDLTVFRSSALDADVLTEAGIESLGTFVALTSNGEVNSVLAQNVVAEFDPPRVLAMVPKTTKDANSSAAKKVNVAFMSQIPFKAWNESLKEGQVKLGTTTLKPSGLAFHQAHLQALIRSGEFLPLLVQRRKTLCVADSTHDWQAGDRIIYLLRDPRPKLLKRLSGDSSSTRLSMETLPEVEEIPLNAIETLSRS